MLLFPRRLWSLYLNRVIAAVHFPSILIKRPCSTIFNRSPLLRLGSIYTHVTRGYAKNDVRAYNPARHIDWVGIKWRWRSKQVVMKKRKLKNHPRVALRFKLTRFGWERLQQGRRGRKLHLSRQKRRNKKRVKFVSRHDMVKLTRQMPGHRLRIRDPPINNNPNIQRLRGTIKSYFA